MGPHETERLSAYMDDELDASARTQVDVHLRECPACARHLQELRAVDTAARELPLAVPDGYFEAFRGALMQRLPRARPAPRRRAHAWTLAAAAAVVLALLTPRLLREPRTLVAPAPSAGPAAPAATAAGGRGAATPPPAAAPRDSPVGRRLQERARPQAPPPAQTAAPTREYATETAGAPSAGYAAAPAETDELQTAPLQTAPQAKMEAESAARADEPKARRDKTALGALRDREARPPASEARFELLIRKTTSSAAEARALRDAWRAYARDAEAGPRADEARVRAVEAGALAWRHGKDESDRARAERDGREYLERPDALQRDRIRDVLRSLSP